MKQQTVHFLLFYNVPPVTMFVPEVPVPGWRLVQPVVVADEELLPGSDGPHRHDAHDVPEPGQQFSLYLCRLL